AAGQVARLAGPVRALAADGRIVSLFIDPDPAQVAAAKALGAHAVEFHTGRYAEAMLAKDAARIAAEFAQLRKSVDDALRVGLTPHAGHGLTYWNTEPV